MRAPLRAWLLVPVLLGLLAAACIGSRGDDEAPPADAQEVPDADPDAAPQVQVPSPLSAVPVDEALLRRPALAVRVDNAPAALPQEGLESAEIVLVTPVEGGLTRLLAVFHAELPERVGPVRSARAADAALVADLAGVFAYAGASRPVLAHLRDSGLALAEEHQPPAAWARDPARQAPHNLFASPAALLDAHPDAPPARRPWPVDEAPGPPSSDPPAEVRLHYSRAAHAGWVWDAAAQGWLRSQDGAPHVTAGGRRVVAANVAIARVRAEPGDGTDAAGNPVVELTVEGEGDALLLSAGRVTEARWHRDPGGPLSWTAADGAPLALRPGPTWVELLPSSGTVRR